MNYDSAVRRGVSGLLKGKWKGEGLSEKGEVWSEEGKRGVSNEDGSNAEWGMRRLSPER